MKAIQEFKKILDKFNTKYQELADYYNIECERCARCCREPISLSSPFELLWLREHFDKLDVAVQEKIINRAEGYIREANERGYVKHQRSLFNFDISEEEKLARLECPLLDNSRCILYEARPITCREYGVPAQDRPIPACFPDVEIDRKTDWSKLYFRIRMLELKYDCDDDFSMLLPSALLTKEDFTSRISRRDPAQMLMLASELNMFLHSYLKH